MSEAEKIIATNKSQIFGVQDLTIEKVEVPEWGMAIHIKSFSGAVRQGYIMSNFDAEAGKVKDLKDLQGKLLVLCICDESGALLLEDTAEDIEELMNKSSSVIDRLFKKACGVNGIGDDDIKELEKNS